MQAADWKAQTETLGRLESPVRANTRENDFRTTMYSQEERKNSNEAPRMIFRSYSYSLHLLKILHHVQSLSLVLHISLIFAVHTQPLALNKSQYLFNIDGLMDFLPSGIPNALHCHAKLWMLRDSMIGATPLMIQAVCDKDQLSLRQKRLPRD